MSQSPAIMWFRRDLRLADNPALMAAIKSERPLVLLYIDETDRARQWGGAKKVWLHHSLSSLERSIQEKGGALIRRHVPLKSFWIRLFKKQGRGLFIGTDAMMRIRLNAIPI